MPSQAYHSEAISSLLEVSATGSNALSGLSSLLIDSRKLSDPASSIFFAIHGERHDGHRYLHDLYQKGVRAFVVEELPADLGPYSEGIFWQVSNSLRALQTLAGKHRSQFTQAKVLAITGSNGKTVLKEWLFQLLREDLDIVRSPKSYNSQVGVPLSVWNLQETNELGIFEAGISQPGEMAFLEAVIQPDEGLFANIGSAHQENFDHLGQKVHEKLQLFKNCKTLFYCKDHELIHTAVEQNDSGLRSDLVRWTWSKVEAATLRLLSTENADDGINVTVKFREEPTFTYFIPFSDQASIENSLHCALYLLVHGYTAKVVTDRMARLTPVAMRLEIRQGVNNCTLINDSYNSDLGSLTVALDLLDQQTQHPEKVVILSDVLGSGQREEALYEQIADLLHQHGVEQLIGVGPAMHRQSEKFQLPQKIIFRSIAEFFEHRSQLFFQNRAVLIKGARPFEFERISRGLQREHHETVLEINLEAMVHNLNHFRSKLQPDTRVMVMVKAFSYGSGAHEIANLLAFHRVDYLAVAYTDEGVALRQAGVNLPIMVMNPDPNSYEAMIRYRLEPEIYRLDSFLRFANDLQKSPFFEGTPYPIHLKLDTGMHRLGFEENEMAPLLDQLPHWPNLKVQSIFTHLSSSDDPAEDDFTKAQIQKFEKLTEKLTDRLDYPVMRHCLNSAGIQRFPEAQFDMVRLGIGLHGIGVNSTEQSFLQPTATLRTVVSQIKTLPAGASIGYGRAAITTASTKVATVAIGYADGLSRQLSKGKGNMWVNGKLAPIIGNVCMDMTMLDVTGIDVSEGDEVVVFGPAHPITAMSTTLDTIPYEILSGISHRVRRIYFQE